MRTFTLTDCPICTGDVVEVTSLNDAVGRWVCINGHWITPARPAPAMALMPYGPAVPTPDDILRGAGLDPSLLS
jgi:hypothetical protein